MPYDSVSVASEKKIMDRINKYNAENESEKNWYDDINNFDFIVTREQLGNQYNLKVGQSIYLKKRDEDNNTFLSNVVSVIEILENDNVRIRHL